MRLINIISILAISHLFFYNFSKAEDETLPGFEDVAPVSEETFPATEEAFPAAEEAAPVMEEALPAAEEEEPVKEDIVSGNDKRESDDVPRRFGIGLNIGTRIHFPGEVNDFITDIWTYSITGDINDKIDSKTIAPGISSKLKVIINLWPFFCIEPYGQFLWSGRIFNIRGSIVKDININNYDFSGGINLWFKFPPIRNFFIKMGAGGYGAYTILKTSGDAGKTELSGSGYGGNGLIGIDLKFSRVVVNVDFIAPIGLSNFNHRTGDLEFYTDDNDYPSKYVHTGIEICPGISFYF